MGRFLPAFQIRQRRNKKILRLGDNLTLKAFFTMILLPPVLKRHPNYYQKMDKKTLLNQSDNQLISDYLKGETASLEILVKKYLKPIYGFIYRYAGSAQDAQDITQEVFVKMWKNLKKFDRQRSFKTWIFSIAKNTAIDFIRKSQSASGGKKVLPFSALENDEDDNFFADALVDPAPLPDELFERKDIAQALSFILEKLTPKYRLVLLLRYNDHFTFREISEALGEPLNTVKSRHRRGLIFLRKLLVDL